MPSGSLLVVSTWSRASDKTSPHNTAELLPDYGSEEKKAAVEIAVDPMARPDATWSVRATRAIPAHQTMKAPALRTQPKLLATTVRFEESSQARDTDVR